MTFLKFVLSSAPSFGHVENHMLMMELPRQFFISVYKRLKQTKLNYVAHNRWVPDEQSPGVQVIFQNNKFAR